MKTFIGRATLLALFCTLLAPAWAADPAGTSTMDRPWKIHQTTPAQYPPRLTYNGVTHGEARVRVSIDATGQLLDALVVACSHRDFGDEALRTVKRWRYEPEWIENQPIGVVADIIFSFEVNGMIAIDKRTPGPHEAYAPIDPFAYQAEGAKRIDRIPTPTQVVAPVYPKEWSDRGIEGTATIEFYIDETGHARIPVAIAADHHLLGASAAAAVAQWRFEPPTFQGKPTLLRAEQVFRFQPEKK